MTSIAQSEQAYTHEMTLSVYTAGPVHSSTLVACQPRRYPVPLHTHSIFLFIQGLARPALASTCLRTSSVPSSDSVTGSSYQPQPDL